MLTEWYDLLKATRSVPLKRALGVPHEAATTSCYAVTFKNIEFSNLKIGVHYRVHAFFFDKESRVFFGRPYYGQWRRSDQNFVDIFDVIFFHYPYKDDSIVLVIELVECENPYDDLPEIYCAAWTLLPLFAANKAITDFNSTAVALPVTRVQFYHGTPKQLIFCETSLDLKENFRKTTGIIELCLQTHQKMAAVSDFLPKFCIVSMNETIPGVSSFSEVSLALCDPRKAVFCSGTLANVTLLFEIGAWNIESAVVQLLNNDRLYRANQSPNNKDIKPLQILERRLKIGLHNGFVYIEEPEYVHLSSADEFDKNKQFSNNRTESAYSSNLRSSPVTFSVRSDVTLKRLIKDPRFAVVFTIDYLVGINEEDGTVSASQKVTLCWGAWCPFGNHFNPNNVTVSFIGGPRINPDHALSFRNLSNISDSTISHHISDDYVSQIRLNFVFFSFDQKNGQIVPQADIPNGYRNENTLAGTEKVGPVIKDYTGKRLPSQTPFSSVLSQKKNTDNFVTQNVKFYKLKSGDKLKRPFVRSEPTDFWISSVGRGIQAFLAEKSFSQIRDRNGNKPAYVAVHDLQDINVNIEKHDQLSTNEVIIQFQAIALKLFDPFRFAPPTRIYFKIYFYRFQTVTTDRLLLKPCEFSSRDNYQFYVLHKLDSYEDLIETDDCGFTVKLTVDRNLLRDGEEDDFVLYLLNDDLIVEVWDADSLMFVGITLIPLKFLLRQGREAVQASMQAKVINSSFPGLVDQTAIIFLNTACVGYSSLAAAGLEINQTTAVVTKRFKQTGQREQNSYKIRAKPLNPIHENAMQRFMALQKLDIKQRYEEIFDDKNIRHMQSLKDGVLYNKVGVKKSLRKIIFSGELEAYKQMRNETKANKLLKAVFDAITTEYRVFPTTGQIEYFEFLLQNTIAEPINVIVEITVPALKLVCDSDMWAFLKYACNMYSPVERDLFHITKNESGSIEVQIFLNPMESVYVPFIYDDFGLNCSESKAIFKKWDDEEPIAILEVFAEKRNNIISQVHHYYEEAETKLSKNLEIQRMPNGEAVLNVRCSDPNVLVSLKTTNDGAQELHFTCYSGPSATTRYFSLYLYADKFNFQLLSVWTVEIHSAYRINTSAIQAQSIKIPLPIQSEHNDQLYQIFSSSPLVSVSSTQQPFLCAKTGEGNIQIALFTPNFSGERVFLLSAVSVSTRKLLAQWLLYTHVKRPIIARSFDISLLTNTLEKKELLLENKYDMHKEYRIISAQPEILSVGEDYVILKPKESASLSLTFLPHKEAELVDVLLFVINADNDMEEETYLFSILYSSE